jgi:hypothetical protein
MPDREMKYTMPNGILYQAYKWISTLHINHYGAKYLLPNIAA